MYTFKASYINMNDNTIRSKIIEVDENSLGTTEKEIYIQVMLIAYNDKKANESFDKLEFLYC